MIINSSQFLNSIIIRAKSENLVSFEFCDSVSEIQTSNGYICSVSAWCLAEGLTWGQLCLSPSAALETSGTTARVVFLCSQILQGRNWNGSQGNSFLLLHSVSGRCTGLGTSRGMVTESHRQAPGDGQRSRSWDKKADRSCLFDTLKTHGVTTTVLDWLKQKQPSPGFKGT